MRSHVQAWTPPKPALVITGGAQHLRDAEPPADWTPPAPVGFSQAVAHLAESEPVTWEGDQA